MDPTKIIVASITARLVMIVIMVIYCMKNLNQFVFKMEMRMPFIIMIRIMMVIIEVFERVLVLQNYKNLYIVLVLN